MWQRSGFVEMAIEELFVFFHEGRRLLQNSLHLSSENPLTSDGLQEFRVPFFIQTFQDFPVLQIEKERQSEVSNHVL